MYQLQQIHVQLKEVSGKQYIHDTWKNHGYEFCTYCLLYDICYTTVCQKLAVAVTTDCMSPDMGPWVVQRCFTRNKQQN